MSVTYNRVNWEQAPSTKTPINATNLNNMDKGIKDVAELANVNEQNISANTADIATLKTTTENINSNLLKRATITGTIQTEKNDYAIGGYLGVASLSSFTGYPTDATEIIAYTIKQTYSGGHLGISCLADNNVVCVATVAAMFTVKAEVLYI